MPLTNCATLAANCNLTKKDIHCSAFLAVFEVRQIYNAAPLTPAPAAQQELLCELPAWQRYRRFDIEDKTFIARCRKLRERLAVVSVIA